MVLVEEEFLKADEVTKLQRKLLLQEYIVLHGKMVNWDV